jgi:hypothetical protein
MVSGSARLPFLLAFVGIFSGLAAFVRNRSKKN